MFGNTKDRTEMSDTTCNNDWNLYKTPKKDILQNRQAFYDLKRETNESNDKWLKRVQSCVNNCEYPIFVEFLLIDRFVCGLNSADMEIIRQTETWSVKQLLDYFLDQNATGNANKNQKSKRRRSLDSESVGIAK